VLASCHALAGGQSVTPRGTMRASSNHAGGGRHVSSGSFRSLTTPLFWGIELKHDPGVRP
jgi:hypothetical protein